jgi:hypothetical protein
VEFHDRHRARNRRKTRFPTGAAFCVPPPIYSVVLPVSACFTPTATPYIAYPAGLKKLPNDLEKLPNDSKKLPNDSEKLPNDLKKLPNDLKKLPRDSEKFPRDLKKLPRESKKLPRESEKLPRGLKKLPRDLKKLPHGPLGGLDDAKKAPLGGTYIFHHPAAPEKEREKWPNEKTGCRVPRGHPVHAPDMGELPDGGAFWSCCACFEGSAGPSEGRLVVKRTADMVRNFFGRMNV